MTRRIETAILISGRGSNMAALIAAARAPDYPAHIGVVIADRPEAGGLALAREAGVEALAIDAKAAGGRTAFESALDAAVRTRGIELICLAGFMRILSADFVGRWPALNIHPSLLPAYKGLDTHSRALADGVREHGCTVHWVAPELDAGEIVAQTRVPVLPGDDAERLAGRVLVAEHALYRTALAEVSRRLIAGG
ncbi:MAG TPA: phosphoribosylglycinamide formyltransferase [Roseiarcus sp.]|nr:phosphoribosylglycinamide formyltransferase [Roseiarcus sp.]